MFIQLLTPSFMRSWRNTNTSSTRKASIESHSFVLKTLVTSALFLPVVHLTQTCHHLFLPRIPCSCLPNLSLILGVLLFAGLRLDTLSVLPVLSVGKNKYSKSNTKTIIMTHQPCGTLRLGNCNSERKTHGWYSRLQGRVARSVGSSEESIALGDLYKLRAEEAG